MKLPYNTLVFSQTSVRDSAFTSSLNALYRKDNTPTAKKSENIAALIIRPQLLGTIIHTNVTDKADDVKGTLPSLSTENQFMMSLLKNKI